MYATSPRQGELHRGELLVWVNSELGMILEITFIKYLDIKKV